MRKRAFAKNPAESIPLIKRRELQEWKFTSAVSGPAKKTLADIPGWDETMISLFREGASVKEVQAALGLGRTAWDRLLEEQPAFKEIVDHGKEMCEAWWESQGRQNLENTKFSAVLWYMNMKNRFGWVDKAAVDYTSNGKAIVPNIIIFGPMDPLAKRLNREKPDNIPIQLDTGEASS